jgi:hypothetical protein
MEKLIYNTSFEGSLDGINWTAISTNNLFNLPYRYIRIRALETNIILSQYELKLYTNQ